MEREPIRTRLGVVPVTGRLGAFDLSRPLVFVIRGAYPDPELMHRLPDLLPEADVALVDLPGMHSPFFAEPGVEAFARGYDEVLATRFPGRRTVALGLSTGALAALAMQGPERLVLMEPPLETGALWPFLPRLAGEVRRTARREAKAWVEAVFGVTAEGVEGRDYRPLLTACRKPGVVMVGGVPLDPPRDLERPPSYVTADAIGLVIRHPTLKLAVIGGAGHNIIAEGGPAILDAVRQNLAAMAAG
ncbi:MAG: hypothetical protein JNL41_08350 [Phenylobacterium sp.]|uniref:alpha/beta fold hydrolase n=1 Tax=Phenylobacterium sp. TaxID=1871053 RepID=UPI001A4D4413|nr:alpha/beta fold hydrolase [Phenylobacterium sp.]MBL8554274.1 hypothetical protein [Phenylobacterium sp.]